MNDTQQISKAKGRPMLTWMGKKPLEKVEYFPAQEKEVYGDKDSKEFNKIFWGDNLQVLSHLLKEYRGKIDLIYIDPPFDSKADYIKKVKIRGEKVEGEQLGVLEEKQYTDIWENDEYLQFMYERLLVIRELLSENGSIYLHCDWHKNSHLRLILDEIFGEQRIVNEIVWAYETYQGMVNRYFARKHDTIYWYSKSTNHIFHQQWLGDYEDSINYERWKGYIVDGNKIKGNNYPKTDSRFIQRLNKWIKTNGRQPEDDDVIFEINSFAVSSVWTDIKPVDPKDLEEKLSYPTQKPESLLERIIKSSTNEDSVILDCFMGSGTTLAVAQKLGRKWIGCDINIGAVQTATKRLASIIEDQKKGNQKLIKDDFKGLLGFKVLNVNDYDIFKNEVEAKDIVMEMYGIEPVKRSWFDGELDNNYVKIMPLNRILNKLDIKETIKAITDNSSIFTPKTSSKSGESIFEQGVIVVCSGAELDTLDYIKKENNTGVDIKVRDILTDKKNLVFKEKPEAAIKVSVENKEATVEITDFHSVILMRKLEVENAKILDKQSKAKVEDFRQIIDSVAIDVDYDGQLFNAEIIDLPSKKEVIKTVYKYPLNKTGKSTIAVKIVDVLGEEYFETFVVEVK